MTLSNLLQRYRRYSEVKLFTVLLTLGLAGFIVGRSCYWYFISDGYGYQVESCASCGCNCSKLDESQDRALAELKQVILPGCDNDINLPDMTSEDKRSKYHLMRGALRVQESKAAAVEALARRALLIVQTKAAKYRKEVEKCRRGMMTAETSTKKVEADLKLERETSALWESRARTLGWRDEEQRFKDNEDI